MIISRTPYRISFFGGGTDYPIWYQDNGGEVLTSSIDKYCYLTCRFLPKFFEHRIRIVYSKIETCRAIEEIKHPSAREALRYLGFQEGIEIHHDGDLPARSGVGSSSAFTVCLLQALHALRRESFSKAQLAREAITVERDILKETVGSQDQVQVAFGGLNHLIFNRDGSFQVHPVTISPARQDLLESHLMLFFTRIPRSASDIAATYIHALSRKENQLDRVKGMVREAIRILEGAGPIADFGALMDESWRIKSGWSEQVAPDSVQEMYQAARASGAFGGKLIGAGGGGFLLLFVPPENQAAVRGCLNRLLEVPFHLENGGAKIIFNGEASEEDFDEAGWADLQKELVSVRAVSTNG